MKPQHWLVKQEPESYSWDDFKKEGRTSWDGVRNFQARNNLKAMRKGDRVLFYASGGPKAVVGTAAVAKPAYPDPTADAPSWVSVELRVGSALARPVSLGEMRSEPKLRSMLLLRHSRLSVLPVSPEEFEHIVELGSRAGPANERS